MKGSQLVAIIKRLEAMQDLIRPKPKRGVSRRMAMSGD